MPFLDYTVVDLALQLPLTYLIHNGWFKWALRKAMQDILPSEVTWRRRKLGFPFPLQSWLSAHEKRFWQVVGVLDCPYISSQQLRDNYQQLSRRDPSYLWRLLNLAMWWQRCICNRTLG